MKCIPRPMVIALFVVPIMLMVGCARSGPRAQELPTEPPREQETSPSTPKEVPQVNGLLEEVSGVRVLKLWGSRQEMGYAHGYLLADQIQGMVEDLLFGHLLEKAASNVTYEGVVDRLHKYILWPEGYEDEMKAMIEGMEAKLGELPVIQHQSMKLGSKRLDADMLAILNASRDLVDISTECSAFAAWGDLTGDGQTRAGGNSDRASDGAIISKYTLVIVRNPDDGLKSVNAGFVGFLGFSRGMNEAGVVTSPTGVDTGPKAQGPCYPAVIVRDIMEQVKSSPQMVDDILQVFADHPRCGATNILFAQGRPDWDNPSRDQMAVVIESDYFGATGRLPSYNARIDTPLTEAIVTTNDFLERGGAGHTENSAKRYAHIVDVLRTRKINDLSVMQEVLQSCQQGCTIISVYLEPDSRKMHVAFSKEGDPPSPQLLPVSFTWEELFAGIPDS